MKELNLFIPLTKVDAENRLVYGTIAAEVPDRSGEIFDYETSKPLFEQWSGECQKVTDGKSVGNLRAMHGRVAAGKLVDIAFDDGAKKIEAVAKVVDDDEWRKCEEGVYTGFSVGGAYARKWVDPSSGLKRYTCRPKEVSLADRPCIPTATFTLIKADGTEEIRPFSRGDEEPMTERTDMQKGEEMELKKVEEILSKVDELTARCEQLGAENKDLRERVEKIENAPEIPKIALRAVGKDEDAGTVQDDKPPEPLRKSDGTVDEEGTALEQIKHAHRNPMSYKF